MRLNHLHISRLLPYSEASHIQERLIQSHFRYKDLLRGHSPSTPLPRPPPPTILTFSTPPTYTVGRRYLPSLATPSDTQLPKQSDYTITQDDIRFLTGDGLATFAPSSRGGLLTYHAPGQLTAYPILNLRDHGLTPKCYVRHLENTVMQTCAALGVPGVTTTSDPGVWIQDAAPPRKICAVGVQVRRGITGHGVGLNVVDEPASEEYVHADGRRAEGYLSWGFGRIVACGLEGKGVTWLAREGMNASMAMKEVAGVFVRQFAAALDDAEGVCEIEEKSVEE